MPESSNGTVSRIAVPSFASAPEALFHVRVPAAWIQAGWTYAGAAQGQRFLFNKVIDVEPELITIVLNWRETLARSR